MAALDDNIKTQLSGKTAPRSSRRRSTPANVVIAARASSVKLAPRPSGCRLNELHHSDGQAPFTNTILGIDDRSVTIDLHTGFLVREGRNAGARRAGTMAR